MKSRSILFAGAIGLALAIGGIAAKAADYSFDGVLRLLGSTATGTAGASTCNNKACLITTESLTTAAGAVFTETVTDSSVNAGDFCPVTVHTGGTGSPAVMDTVATANTLTIKIQNIHASAAFNNTLTIQFGCFRP